MRPTGTPSLSDRPDVKELIQIGKTCMGIGVPNDQTFCSFTIENGKEVLLSMCSIHWASVLPAPLIAMRTATARFRLKLLV